MPTKRVTLGRDWVEVEDSGSISMTFEGTMGWYAAAPPTGTPAVPNFGAGVDAAAFQGHQLPTDPCEQVNVTLAGSDRLWAKAATADSQELVVTT